MAQKAKPVTARIASAGSGGPGMFRGSDYQLEYAVLQSLYVIWQHLYEPLKSFSIGIEPRIVHSGAVTRWDVRTDPPLIASEAKANLSKDDLTEFLQRAGETNDLDGSLTLVYGRCNTPLLAAAIRLHGIAIECGQDHSKFDELVAREAIPNAALILKELGPNYRHRLPRLVFEGLPEMALKRELGVCSRSLFPAQPSRLVDFLFKRFSEGAESRQQYEASELVQLIEQAGMTLTRPARVELTGLPEPAVSALALLQELPSGLPQEVVSSAVNASAEQIRTMLSELDWVSVDEGIWRIPPLPFQVPVRDRSGLLRRGFESLLDFLSSHQTDRRAEEQLGNSIKLARLFLPDCPGLALRLFQSAEHIVKNLGDKHLLLEISDLCIDAGQQNDGGDKEQRAYARAQAMLCGRSWVLQRTGRLQEARVWAEKSLELGEKIGWDRNTAFAKKCIGRLDRVEAEQPETSNERKSELIRSSSEKILEAIRMFSGSGEFGSTHLQVGDCCSLLARTYLTARMQSETEAALKRAYGILPPSSTKEYFDLLILTGDYEVLWGSREQADRRYSEVIDQHSKESREHSEILARALSKRALNRIRINREPGALSDYRRSAEVWGSLDEHDEAAKMEWAWMELGGKIDAGTLQLFNVEPRFLVRLSAYQMYAERLEGSKALARRSRPSPVQVQQYIKEAHKKCALDYPEW
jgi:tetratricopeptide (TPR) repeat protein